VREQLEMLEHHADAGAQARQVCPRVADGNTVDHDAPLLEGLQAIDALDQRRSPEPEGPQTTTTSPLATVVLQP
jgi:hypothetical protein